MRANPLPLINGFYADETRPWSQQDVVNWLPVSAEQEGTRTPTMLKTPPGLSPYARVSGEPVRGTYNAEGRFFAVMGDKLYQITTTASIQLGTIPGTGRVRFSHNQITGGNQVLIVNGSAGFVWNTVTSTLTTITDEGYPGAIDAVFIDGYLVQIEPARRFAFNSDLADALSYNTLDRFTSEVSPDLLVALAVSNNELVVFSESTTEFFENTGATQQPFRSKRIAFNKGCAGRYTVATMDNTVFWLGDDGVFYNLNGYSPQRISTRPIEQMIRGLNWAQAFAFVWETEGHSVVYWTFPDGATIGFDAAQGKWHRRKSYEFNRWRLNSLTYWQNKWFGGDFQKGRIYELDWAYPWEFDTEFISECTGPVIHDNQSRVLMPRMEIIMDTGMEEVPVRDWEIDQPALALSGDAPPGVIGDAYSYAYTATGGVPTIAFSISAGAIPPGLTLSSTGVLSGTPTTGGTYTWTVRAIDGDGDTVTLGDSALISSGTVTLTALTAVAPALATVIAWSPDSTYCAIASRTSPYLHVYKRTGDTFALLTLPALGLADRPQGLDWHLNGLDLAVAPEAAVTPFILHRSADTFTKEALTDQNPGEQERGFVYSPDGANLALTYEDKMYGWNVVSGVYTAAGLWATFTADGARSMQASDYSSDGELFVTGLTISPYLNVFTVSGDTYTISTAPPSIPADSAYQPRFSSDAKYLGWAVNVSPFYALYERNIDTNTFTQFTGLPVAVASPICFEWSPTGANFATCGSGANMQVYRRNGTTVTLQATLASSGTTTAIGWAPNGQYIAAGNATATTFVKVT